MGTRSSIFVKRTTKGKTRFYRFYKHWDGYPTGNLPVLLGLIAGIKIGRLSVKRAMLLAATIDGSKVEFEGIKGSLDLITKHNEHGDLEWSYLVDLDSRKIEISAASDGTSRRLNDGLLTDPLEYVSQLRTDCRAEEKWRLEDYLKRLKSMGYSVN